MVSDKGGFVRKVWVLLGAACAVLVIAAVIPAIVMSTIKPIPVDTTRTVTTKPAPTQVYLCNPECHVEQMTTSLHRELKTSKAEDKDEVNLDVSEDFRRQASNDSVISLRDHVRLIRHSTYPVLDPVTHLELRTPWLTFDTANFARDGLQYFFPFNTERRSYQFFDVFAQQAFPLDYVRQDDDVYIFHQHVRDVAMDQAAIRALTHPADISDDTADATAEDIDEHEREQTEKLEGTTYSVERTLWVEPKSGVILNQEDHLKLQSRSGQTLFATTTEWDDASQQRAHELAQPVVNAIQWMRLGTFASKVVVMALLAAAALAWARR